MAPVPKHGWLHLSYLRGGASVRSAGQITIGVKVLDERRVEITEYVKREDHDALRRQLREAKAEADHWEQLYHALRGGKRATSEPRLDG